MSKSRDIADSAATINFIDNVTSDVQSQLNTLTTAIDNVSVTSGTLTKTFTQGESSTINLTSSVLAPVVSVTKEVPQSGVTNNNWDVNSTTENYTRLNSAPATTLDFNPSALSLYSLKNSLDVSANTTQPTTIRFNDDGTIMYTSSQEVVYQYSLSTAFDTSTASYSSKSLDFSAQAVGGYGGLFNNDGTLFYITDRLNDTVYQYSLTTAWDISTASYASKSFSFASQETDPRSISFNDDGTKMFVVGPSSDSVHQYSLSSAYDVSTASYDSLSFSVASQEPSPTGLVFSSTGLTFYITGFGTDSIYKYTLSTAWQINTASYSGQSLDISAIEVAPLSIALDNTNTKIYIGGNGSDVILQYNPEFLLTLGTGSFASADVGKTIEANDGAFVLTATDGSYVETTAPTSYDQVASGSWEMYGVVYNAADGDLEVSGVQTGQFDVSTSAYLQSFSLASQEGGPSGIAFNSDGTKMFIIGVDGDDVNEYTLSTGFDVSTSSFVDSFSVSSQETSPQDLWFNSDGTKMYIIGLSSDTVYQYSLSTGFDVSTASYSSISFSVSLRETNPFGLALSTDGTKLFISGSSSQSVHEFALSTAFNVSTAGFTRSFSVSAQDSFPMAIAFNADGTKMFIAGEAGRDINEYTLTTGFDLSTASFVDSFNVSAQEIFPNGLAFSPDGTKMFVVGSDSDSVHQYSVGLFAVPTGYQPVHTTQSTDTTYWTDINSMTADQAAGDGNVYYAISTDDRTTWTVIDNTDGERDIVRNNAGTWQYNSNGTYASETWTNATTNTELAALAEAMEGAVDEYSLSDASYDSVSFSVTSQESQPNGIAFNTDGTKMFIIGQGSNTVYEYALSTAFNVDTASYSSVSFSAAGQETSCQDLAFNADGTKMFIVGRIGDDVNEYTLSTAFNVSTASFVDSFSVSAQETDLTSVTFNTDGTKMFILGFTSDSVHEYALSTGFDVSTASFTDSFSIASQETNPDGLTFNASGTKMFVLGYASDTVYEYTLSTAFDISTASYSSNSFSVSSQDTTPLALVFSANGSKLFIVGQSSDTVYQYSTGAYVNQMDKTQLDAVTDPNHIALGNDLDLAIVFNMTSGTTVPSSDGVAINYDANVLNKGAVLGTDYDFDAPAGDKVRVTALTSGNFKVRVV